ncbi:hypothetical protein IWQ60_011707 [Tieghemiomyces parasiticus]|uniref:Histone deacetylase complex subunit SAP18 n=1 Tax=Tieghemiomyces parasiticus TaxID=78921 RepID=A0A9W7ZI45_9FUNG|nr:hypothetical protein IWQ60_011707 [Tieghemiomyces parasiticus]
MAANTKQYDDSAFLQSAVDRERSTPFLLRIFYNFGSNNALSKYNARRQNLPNELQVYTWRDATLKEIASLIQEVVKEARSPTATLRFHLVYPNPLLNQYSEKPLGTVVNGAVSPSDKLTLADCRLVIGDFLDVAILTGAVDTRSHSQSPDSPQSDHNSDSEHQAKKPRRDV